MPCLFFRNVPENVEFESQVIRALHIELQEVVSSTWEVHIENTQYVILDPSGLPLEPHEHGVHVFVEWHGGRGIKVKIAIARAVQRFLQWHGLGEGSDLTFRDSPSETFFFEGKLVEGGLPRR